MTLTRDLCERRLPSVLPDVFIIGGGPAGATAARLLASWGWSVRVAHRSTSAISRPSLAESLPPSTRKLLAFLGQLDIVDAAGFHPNHGNIARWAHRGSTSRARHSIACCDGPPAPLAPASSTPSCAASKARIRFTSTASRAAMKLIRAGRRTCSIAPDVPA
ncbi:MAG: hypothetical protein DMG01_22540 [Acidobacteria bacterium]|nr:MAG: hypothetical protein DMG01_22540 [Acidobacteriota bacterium]